MRGHIAKRGATWTVTYDEPAVDGKRRQRSKGGFATKRDAQTFLTETLSRLAGGTYSSPSRLTVDAFLADEWLPTVRGTLRPLSVQRYESTVRLYITPHVGHVRLQQLSGGHLNGMYAQLEQAGLSIATRRLVHAVIGRALRDAERWDASRATPRGRPILPLVARRGLWRGRRASSGVSSSTSARIASTRCGGSRRPRVCAAASWPASRGEHSPATRTTTAISSSPTRSADRSERNASHGGSPSTARLRASRLGPCTRSGTRRRRSRSPRASRYIVAARLGDDAKTVLASYAHLLPQSDELAAERIAAALVSVP